MDNSGFAVRDLRHDAGMEPTPQRLRVLAAVYRRGLLGDTLPFWVRHGPDPVHGGLLYFTDVRGLPMQEYWATIKFWWPHHEAVIATLLAWQLTGDKRQAARHTLVHDWAHRVFPDPNHGEWFGYAERTGRITTQLKGNLWKGPFHLPRMQWYCGRLIGELQATPPAHA